jgi:glutathione S-transferase
MKIVEEKEKPLKEFFAVFDKQLEGKDYLVANKFTLADAVYMPCNRFSSFNSQT